MVDDEPMILELVVAILEDQDQRIEATEDPLEALKFAERHRDQIVLLITDMTMSDMNGDELAIKIKALCPRLKTLFMSGRSADDSLMMFDPDRDFIKKPFSVTDLSDKVASILR